MFVTICPAELSQSLIERINVGLHLGVILGEADDCPDTAYSLAPLRLYGERPSHRAAQ